MAPADEYPDLTLAINNAGLLLFHNGAGTWLICGSADGLTHAASDRLVWLLPLLERGPAEISAALPQVPMAATPIPDLVRFALTAWGEHWPALALGWLESGRPAGGLLDVLAGMKDSHKLSQSLRHRALRLWRTAGGDSGGPPGQRSVAGVLPPVQLRLMCTVPDVPYPGGGPARYPAGLERTTFLNGVTVWGKSGSVPGYPSAVFATPGLARAAVHSPDPTGNRDSAEIRYMRSLPAAAFGPSPLR